MYPLSNYVEGHDYGAPTVSNGQKVFEFVPPIQRIPTKALPRLSRYGFSMTAEVEIPRGRQVDGMLVAYGSRLGGFASYVRKGRMVFANNVYGRDRQVVASQLALPVGKQRLGLDFEPAAKGSGGIVRLRLGEQVVAEQRIDRLGSPVLGSFGVGQAYTSPISDDYTLPFAFTGALHRLRLVLH